MRRRHAFTLVELLVVIGIIALLISILLPALNKARRAAMALECSSNMRQLGNSIMFYANDHKGTFPPGLWTGNPATYGLPAGPTYSGPAPFRWFMYIGMKYYPNQFVAKLATPTQDPLMPYRIGKQNPEHNVFMCPDDEAARVWRFNNNPNSPDIDQAGQGMSYVGNQNILKIHDATRMGRVKNSQSVILLTERKGDQFLGSSSGGGNIIAPRTWGHGNLDTISRMPRLSEGFNLAQGGSSPMFGRHGSGVQGQYQRSHNVLFADFHVAAVPFREIWTGLGSDFASGTEGARTWGQFQ